MGRAGSGSEFHVNFGSVRVESLHLWVGLGRVKKLDPHKILRRMSAPDPVSMTGDDAMTRRTSPCWHSWNVVSVVLAVLLTSGVCPDVLGEDAGTATPTRTMHDAPAPLHSYNVSLAVPISIHQRHSSVFHLDFADYHTEVVRY